MEEFVETTEAEQTSDAFLEGFSEEDTAFAEADQPEADEVEEVAEEAVETAEEEQTAPAAEEVDSPAEVTPDVPEEKPAEPAAAPRTWTLKHMDDPERVVNEQELVGLANKGMDYDRVRSLYEEAKPILKIWESAAKQHDMSVSDYTALVRQNLIESEGATPELAKRMIAMEDRQFANQPVSDPYYPPEPAYEAPAPRQDDRASREIREFTQNYPDVREVPQEVWNAVRDGVNLTAAYSRYISQQVQAQMAEVQRKQAASAQNAENANRATGSMQSAGQQKKVRDPFLEGFEE